MPSTPTVGGRYFVEPMVDVTVEGLDMTYKVGQATAKARLDAWMTPAHDLGPCRVRRSDRAMDAGLVSASQAERR